MKVEPTLERTQQNKNFVAFEVHFKAVLTNRGSRRFFRPFRTVFRFWGFPFLSFF